MRSLSSLADGCKILAASIARRAKIWLTILASLEVKNLAAGEASPFTLIIPPLDTTPPPVFLRVFVHGHLCRFVQGGNNEGEG